MDYSVLRHCTELRDVHIIEAVKSSEAMEALLARFVELAGPGRGAPVILAALARLGTTACDWIDGELRIEIAGDAVQTKIAVSSSLGAGFHEKCFADTVLEVPLEEFAHLLARAPKLIAPLQIAEKGARIVLMAPQEVRATSLPPPVVEISSACLICIPPHGAPPSLDPPPSLEPAPPSTRALGPKPELVLRPREKDEK